MRLIKLFFKPLLWFVLSMCLLASQAALLLVPAFTSMMFSAVSHWIPDIPNPWKENATLKAKNADLIERNRKLQLAKTKVKPISGRIARRLTRNVTMNVGSLALEAVPILGIVTMIAVTAVDVNDACNTMDDMNELLDVFGEQPETAATDEICGYRDKIPSVQELNDMITPDWL